MKVAICAITFKRAQDLTALLDSLAGLSFTRMPRPEMIIIITDNDASGSARPICDSARTRHGYDLRYMIEPQQGIPLARNTGMQAVPTDFDYAAWVDDDETVSPHWLEELLLCAIETQAQLVSGPVNALYPPDTPDWLIKGGFFDRKPWKDRAILPMAATNNLLIHMPSWHASGLRFDPRLRFTGSSDTLLTMQAIRHHSWVIVRAALADVYELQPAARLTQAWIIQRQYRIGNGLTLCAILLDGWAKAAPLRLLKGAGNIGYGICLWAAGVGRQQKIAQVKGRGRIARGLGIIAGLFGHSYQEYAPKKLS